MMRMVVVYKDWERGKLKKKIELAGNEDVVEMKGTI